MNKFLSKTLFVISLFSLLFILFYAFILWAWGDDMLYIHILSKKSLIDFTLNEGKTIDARWLTPLAFIRNFVFKYIPHSFAISFYILIYFISTYLLFFKLLEINISDKKEKFIFWTFFSLILFYGLNKITGQVIFWQAGAYYSLNLFFGLLWIIYFKKITFQKKSNKTIIIFILFSLLAGTLTYNLSVALVTYAVLTYIINSFKNYEKTIIGLIIIITVTFILILSPSALNRATDTELSLFQQVMGVFRAFIHVPKNYFSNSYTLIILLALFSITYYFYNPKKNLSDINIKGFKSLINYLFFPLIAFSTIAPFLVAPHLASLRTALYFMIFGSLFVLNFYNDILTRILKMETPLKNLSGIIILFFFIFHIFIFADHYYIAYDIKKQHKERHNYLIEKAKNNVNYVELKPYNFQFTPFTLQFLKSVEPTNNYRNYRNVHYQICYGIDTIIIKQ